MTENIIICAAKSGDADMIAILVNQLIQESFANEDKPSAKQIQIAAEDLLANNNAHAIIAYNESEAVGVMTITEAIAVHARGKFGIIMEFFVLPSARSKGVGLKMLDYIHDFSVQNNWRWLELSLPQGGDKQAAEEFFMRNGFHNIGPSLRKQI